MSSKIIRAETLIPTEYVTDLDQRSKMIIFGLIFDHNWIEHIFGGSWTVLKIGKPWCSNATKVIKTKEDY